MRHIKENPHDGIERELNIHDNIDIVIYVNGMKSYMTCSIPRRAVRSHFLVCSKNYLLIIGIEPIINKEIELILWYDCSDRTCVYS